MKYNVKTDIENNVYTATFSVLEITELEKENIKDFGELKLNVGGDIIKDSVVLYELSDKFINFPSQMPYTRSFNDVMLGGKAKEIAEIYVENMKTNIDAVIVDIKSRIDDFSADEDIIV